MIINVSLITNACNNMLSNVIRIIMVIMDIRILLTITIKDEMDTYYLYHAPERY